MYPELKHGFVMILIIHDVRLFGEMLSQRISSCFFSSTFLGSAFKHNICIIIAKGE